MRRTVWHSFARATVLSETNNVGIENRTGFFSRVGIDIHAPQNIKFVPLQLHRKSAYDYNQLWYAFIEENPNATKKIIEQAAVFIMAMTKQ